LTAGTEPAVFFLQAGHFFGLRSLRANQRRECVILTVVSKSFSCAKVFTHKEIFKKKRPSGRVRARSEHFYSLL